MEARAHVVLAQVLAVPPEMRSSRADELCGDDPTLRAEVLELLAYHGQSGDLLDSLRLPGLAFRAGPPVPATIGPWRTDGILGEGATAVVYRARRDPGPGHELGPPVALKVFRGGWLASESERRRFLREAATLARLDHAGIPRLLESGLIEPEPDAAHAPHEPSVPFLATELVEGRSLRTVLATDRPAQTSAVDLIDRLAEILAYAHARDVVHRDLKPDNIVLDAKNRPHVLDFGVARLVAPPGSEALSLRTQVGQLMGTPAYMSPEQVHAGPEPVDHRADLYALGVIAFELLAGRRPYDTATDQPHHAMLATVTAEPVPLGTVAPQCRGNLESIVHRLLAKSPVDRYPTADSLREDLQRHRQGKRIHRYRSNDRATTPSHQRPRRQRTIVTAAIAVLLIAGIVTIALARWQRGAPERRAERERVAVAESMRDMAAARQLIHGQTRTPESTQRAITLLTGAYARLDEASNGRGYGKLTSLLLGRVAEAHSILGAFTWDRAQFALAKEALGTAWGYGERLDIVAPLDTLSPIYKEVLEHEYSNIAPGMAGAELALAELETPLLHAELAVQDMQHTPGWMWSIYRQAPPGSDLAGERFRGYCMSLNEYAAAHLLRGRLTSSLADIDTALAYVRRADRLWDTPTILAPRGSMVQRMGEVWMARAAVTGSAAERDSARACFERALGFRPPTWNPRAFRVNHTWLARHGLAEAAAAPDAAERDDALAQALQRFRFARSRAADMLAAGREAYDRVLEAQMETMLAKSGADPSLIHADSLLTHAATVLGPDHYPLQHADILRARAQWHEQRAWLGAIGTDSDREMARAAACLREACELVPAADDPAGHRALQEQLAQVEGRPSPTRRPRIAER